MKSVHVVRDKQWLADWKSRKIACCDFSKCLKTVAKEITAIEHVRFARKFDGGATHSCVPGLAGCTQFLRRKFGPPGVCGIVVTSICVAVKTERDSIIKIVRPLSRFRDYVVNLNLYTFVAVANTTVSRRGNQCLRTNLRGKARSSGSSCTPRQGFTLSRMALANSWGVRSRMTSSLFGLPWSLPAFRCASASFWGLLARTLRDDFTSMLAQ